MKNEKPTPNEIPNSPTSYSVNLWGSHPEDGNDDCWSGADYATLAEAQQVAADVASVFDSSTVASTAFIEIDGPDHNSITPRPGYNAKRREREAAREAAEWKREAAMQAGMAFGCDGYNDEMGF